MISTDIRKIALVLFALVIMLPTTSFEALFSERTTLNGEPLDPEYDLKAACTVIEGMQTFHFIDNEIIPSNQITALCEDKYGNVFIGTRDTGVIKFSAITSNRAVFNKFPVEDSKKHGQIAIHKLVYNNRDKRIYAATTGGLFYIIDNDNFSSASCRAVEIFGDRTITALAISSSGDIWAGTSEGLFNYKGEHYTESDGLPCDRIVSLLFDNQDDLWVGTETGLAVRRGDTFRTVEFKDREKLWITDLALTKPIELMIPVEKYLMIAEAFFDGIRQGKHYNEKDRANIDETMQHMLDIAKPGAYKMLIATTDGLFQADISRDKAEELKDGWMYCTEFKDTGLMYSVNNCAEIINLSPTTRDLARFDINRRFRRRMIGRMLREIRKEAKPALLDEATIEDLYGKDEDRIMPELVARLDGLRATSMLIDSNNLFWLGLNGAGLFVVDAKRNTGDFFVKALGPYIDKDGTVGEGTKYRYYAVSSNGNALVETEDMLQGRAHYLGAFWGKFGCFPLKSWINHCSYLQDDDWKRIARYIGRSIAPKPILEFLAVLGSDPYIFIPFISNGDIPDLKKSPNADGFIEDDEEFIKAHETYELPKLFIDEDNIIETYPENHPESRVNERTRELPVESTFDDTQSH